MPATGRNRSDRYTRLENRLVLLAWLNRFFGYERNRDMLQDLRETAEGFDAEGRSHVVGHLLARGPKCAVPRGDLERYDANIHAHLAAMNQRRSEPITLRYFQYISLLYTEIFLDRYTNHRRRLLHDLNQFVRERNTVSAAGMPVDPEFVPADLTKLAFWMATGSGKTLILHANYYQFLHYNREPLDNILLITPNEGLSQQHIEQMTASGIPCERFSLEESGLAAAARNRVRVIEITKLVEKKRGGGVSVPVEAFEGNNLIFVDEGHKGSGGEVYRGFRDQLGRTGFTFEYSATFGQALNATRNDALTDEYAKAIHFDYSYKYFYGDGFGKDFRILNLRRETSREQTDTLLLANLLSFYEQCRYFRLRNKDLQPYNLAAPLWVFVGSSVNAVYREGGEPRSDVLTVVQFLDRFLQNRQGWAVETIGKILSGRSGLELDRGLDLFAKQFETLRDWTDDAGRIHADILKRVFHAPAGGRMEIQSIRGGDGEIGLRVAGNEDYFGLIYIGDAPSFRKLVEEKTDIPVGEDVIVDPMFEQLNRPGSSVNLLIGAKKFMEGWDSWRVSNMGLLNIGRSEGSEIIQLFGRGVRLKGLDSCLKRSREIRGRDHPKQIHLLEQLNIFAIRADYMAQFRNYLEREGVDPGGYLEFDLPLWQNKAFLREKLYTPHYPKESSFPESCRVVLKLDESAKISLDVTCRVDAWQSTAGGIHASAAYESRSMQIPTRLFHLMDWEAITLRMIEYKQSRGWSNLVIPRSAARSIMEARDPVLCELIAPNELVDPKSVADLHRLEDAVVSALSKYVEKSYRVEQQRWDSNHMVYEPLKVRENVFEDYRVSVPASEPDLVKAVRELIEEGRRIYRETVRELPNIYFDRHIYQPLLIERDMQTTSSPPGLNPGEIRFVENLRDFCKGEGKDALGSKKLFLLRNLSKGKGIGFFENHGFYPDFILWVKQGRKQRIVFVEPHGMRQEDSYWRSDKTQLHIKLREYSQPALKKAKLGHIELDAFIISTTPYDELRNKYAHDGSPWTREEFTAAHILFFDRDEHYDYLPHLF